MSRIIVHIDHLALRGFRHEDRHAVAAGLQAELSRLFAQPEIALRWAASGDAPRLRASDVHIASGSKPTQVGRDVARGIAREGKS